MKFQRYTLTLKKDGVLNLAERQIQHDYIAAAVLWEELKNEPFEVVVLLALNSNNHVIGLARLATTGSVSSCSANILSVYKHALLMNATAIILGHNHPSGDPSPSLDDISFTEKVAEIGRTLSIPLLDHVIVARGEKSFHHYSFQSEGKLRRKPPLQLPPHRAYRKGFREGLADGRAARQETEVDRAARRLAIQGLR